MAYRYFCNNNDFSIYKSMKTKQENCKCKPSGKIGWVWGNRGCPVHYPQTASASTPTNSVGVSSKLVDDKEQVRCNRCGKRVSTEVPKGTIVRAWVECPECIEKDKPQTDNFASDIDVTQTDKQIKKGECHCYHDPVRDCDEYDEHCLDCRQTDKGGGWEERYRKEIGTRQQVIDGSKTLPPRTRIKFVELYDEVEDFIRKELASQKSQIVEQIKTIDKKAHICAFNDGKQNCNCYAEALFDVIEKITWEGGK